jgi:uncharacterized membrane protein YkvA (DUF1232 family)
MSTKPPRIPEILNRYLRASFDAKTTSIAAYVEQGGALIDHEAIAALRDLLSALRGKIETVATSERLRSRLELLALYFEETLGDTFVHHHARRDTTFALFYFLKGYDRIPDSVPEVGLLDDALIVESALTRHLSAFREHWLRRGRVWPENA